MSRITKAQRSRTPKKPTRPSGLGARRLRKLCQKMWQSSADEHSNSLTVECIFLDDEDDRRWITIDAKLEE